LPALPRPTLGAGEIRLDLAAEGIMGRDELRSKLAELQELANLLHEGVGVEGGEVFELLPRLLHTELGASQPSMSRRASWPDFESEIRRSTAGCASVRISSVGGEMRIFARTR
jgi:hypothetical protein